MTEDSKYLRLRQAKKQLKFTNNDIAILLGMTEGGVRHAIRNETLKELYFNLICDEFLISKEWLFHGRGSMRTEDLDFSIVDPSQLLSMIDQIKTDNTNPEIELLKSEIISYVHYVADLKSQNQTLKETITRYRRIIKDSLEGK